MMEHIKSHDAIQKLTAENARLRRQVERQQECIDNVWEILDDTPTINPNNYSYDKIADLRIAIHASLVRIEYFRQLDVIVDAATAIDKTATDPENNGG